MDILIDQKVSDTFWDYKTHKNVYGFLIYPKDA